MGHPEPTDAAATNDATEAKDASGGSEPMTAAEGAELVESASVQNAVAVTGPGALLMVPLAKVLTVLQQKLRRR